MRTGAAEVGNLVGGEALHDDVPEGRRRAFRGAADVFQTVHLGQDHGPDARIMRPKTPNTVTIRHINRIFRNVKRKFHIFC